MNSLTSERSKIPPQKCKEVSLDGCRLIGRGLKGEVYRYDDELIIKIYNSSYSYGDVEREAALCRRAFVLGVPTAISFGVVSVGDRYGAMYELVDAETLSALIAANPSRISYYAKEMADLAHTVHGTVAEDKDDFPEVKDRFREYIINGLQRTHSDLAGRCMKLLDDMPQTKHLIHGDFHTSNVFLHGSETLLIDMDRLSVGDPVFELGDMYLYFVSGGRNNPDGPDPYLGISYAVCREFFELFMKHYLKQYFKTEDETRIGEAMDKAKLLADLRLINRYWKAGELTEESSLEVDDLTDEIKMLLDRIKCLSIVS
ncbi:MAG: phosphotransferase [Lachnospiraceae bacterium]|nr:phosphotransferase [Lachnospiraceae bacterium]